MKYVKKDKKIKRVSDVQAVLLVRDEDWLYCPKSEWKPLFLRKSKQDNQAAWSGKRPAWADSNESGDQSITATNVEPDEQVIVARDVGNEIGDQVKKHDIDMLMRLDGDKINLVVRANFLDGPLPNAEVFVSDYNEDGLACVRMWGFRLDAAGLFYAGQFPAGKMLLQVRKDGWLPFGQQFISFVYKERVNYIAGRGSHISSLGACTRAY